MSRYSAAAAGREQPRAAISGQPTGSNDRRRSRSNYESYFSQRNSSKTMPPKLSRRLLKIDYRCRMPARHNRIVPAAAADRQYWRTRA